MAARNVWKRRNELQGNVLNPFNEAPIKSIVTTEIQVTSEPRRSYSKMEEMDQDASQLEYDPYSVHVKVGGQGQVGDGSPTGGGFLRMRQLTRTAANAESNTEAVLYARSAFFYFIALLIIWVSISFPSSFPS